MSEAIHCFDRAAVRFAIYPDGLDGARVLAEIHENALRDVFGAREGADSLLHAFDANAGWIEQVAVQRYRRRPGDAIMLESDAFAVAPRHLD